MQTGKTVNICPTFSEAAVVVDVHPEICERFFKELSHRITSAHQQEMFMTLFRLSYALPLNFRKDNPSWDLVLGHGSP